MAGYGATTDDRNNSAGFARGLPDRNNSHLLDLAEFADQAEIEIASSFIHRVRTFESRLANTAVLGFWGWALVFAGIELFGGHENGVYHYNNHGCHCVLVNLYFGLVPAYLAIAASSTWSVGLLHNPRSGAFSLPFSDKAKAPEWPERSVRAALRRPVSLSLASIFVFVLVNAPLMLAVLPVLALIQFYVGFGFAYALLFLGICRSFCDDEAILETAKFGGVWMEDFYTTTFGSKGWDHWPERLAPWGKDDEGVVFLTRVVWAWVAATCALAWVCDLVIAVRLLALRRVVAARMRGERASAEPAASDGSRPLLAAA